MANLMKFAQGQSQYPKPSSARPASEEAFQSEEQYTADLASEAHGRDMVKEFVNQVLEGQMTLSRDADATIVIRIEQIDRLISLQLREVMHHPSFRKLESTWRGIKEALDQPATEDLEALGVLQSQQEFTRRPSAAQLRQQERVSILNLNDNLDSVLF